MERQHRLTPSIFLKTDKPKQHAKRSEAENRNLVAACRHCRKSGSGAKSKPSSGADAIVIAELNCRPTRHLILLAVLKPELHQHDDSKHGQNKIIIELLLLL